MWLDLELSGTRPAPLLAAAMATIDQHRAFLLGMDRSSQSHSFMLNLQNKVVCKSIMANTNILVRAGQ